MGILSSLYLTIERAGYQPAAIGIAASIPELEEARRLSARHGGQSLWRSPRRAAHQESRDVVASSNRVISEL